MGRVYVYRVIIRDFSTTLELATKDLPRPSSSLAAGSRFGASLASLGDLDGDRYEDFAVGSPFEGERGEGAVYIYRGSATFSFNGQKQGRQIRAFSMNSEHGKNIISLLQNNRRS